MMNELTEAVINNDLERIRWLLASPTPANASSASFTLGATLLRDAAFRGYQSVVELLLAQHVPIDAQGRNGRAALHEAVLGGHQAMVERLLTQGAECDLLDQTDMGIESFCNTPLHLAVFKGYKKIIELLVNWGADPNIPNGMLETPLHEASRQGDEAIITLLLDHKAYLNTQNTLGRTALHEAARLSHTKVVRLLLENGAKVDLLDEDRRTPLHAAVWQSDEKTAELLLDHKADPNIPGTNGWTLLHSAVFMQQQQVVVLLLAQGARIDSQDALGNTPLHTAADHGNVVILKQLLAFGARLCLPNESGDTALHVAVREENNEVVKLLLQQGAYSYQDEKTEQSLVRLWEDEDDWIREDLPFYTTLLLAGVKVPKDKILPQSLVVISEAIEATIEKWFAPLELSKKTLQENIPNVLRLLPRLLGWVKAVQLFEIKRQEVKKSDHALSQAAHETVAEILLISTGQEDAFLAKEVLTIKQAILQRLKAGVLPNELLLVIRDQIIQKTLVATSKKFSG